MKILAVRGENLASLAGTFEVNFEADPIRSSGIFAITGPTGAGKTTLLDAICLALYDQLPRMDTAEKGVMIGRTGAAQQLGYNDVRGILRHGTGSGFAEVDFVGQDGGTYRAHWEVRRAHGKSNGSIQDQKLSLRDLAADRIISDHRKTETLALIERKVGLGFEQFRRSVLLAQGDFDAFLRANAKERSELLERITGTEIYSRISREAYSRAKIEQEKSKLLEARLADNQPLSEEQRSSVEIQIAAAASEFAKKSEELQQLRTAEEWYIERERLSSLLRDAQDMLVSSLRESDASEPAAAHLATVKKGISARAEVAAYSATLVNKEKCESRTEGASGQLGLVTSSLTKAAEAHDASILRYQYARSEYDKIVPELDRAKALDTLIDANHSALEASVQDLNRARNESNSILLELGQTSRQFQESQQMQAADIGWLGAHAATEQLAVRREEIFRDLTDLADAQEKIKKGGQQRDSLASEYRKLSEELNASQVEHDHAIKEYQQAIEHVQQATLEVNVGDRLAFEAKRDEIAQGTSALTEAKSHVQLAARATRVIVNEDHQVLVEKAGLEKAGAAVIRANAQQPIEQARLDEARRALELSEASGTKVAERLREKLMDGEPCPVCGSKEHPVTEIDIQLKMRIELDRGRVAEVEAVVKALNGERAAGQATIEAATKSLASSSERRARGLDDLAQAEHLWRKSAEAISQCFVSLGLDLPDFPESVPTHNAELLESIERELSEIFNSTQNEIRLLADAEQRLANTIASRDHGRNVVDKLGEALSKLKDRCQVVNRELERLDTEATAANDTSNSLITRIDNALSGVMSDWRQRLERDGEELFRAYRTEVVQWETRKDRAERLNSQIQVLGTAVAALTATRNEKEQTVIVIQGRLDRLNNDSQEKKEQRQQVLGGQPHLEVRNQHSRACEIAETAWRTADDTRKKLERDCAGAEEGLRIARDQSDSANQEHASASEKLNAYLSRLCLTLEQAQDAIELGEQWVSSEQNRLELVRQAVVSAEAVLAERRNVLSNHIQLVEPSCSQEELPELLDKLHIEIQNTNAVIINSRALLQNDDELQARCSGLREQHRVQSEITQVWSQIDKLIGAADGGKFRKYAQSLTFDQLVNFANRHLSDLKPRYELQRPTGADLSLQVIDHHLADEVRAVHSLSGGEKFLVSLALALGLASMSSNRGIRVETLFIDEGFGALDSSSLSMAIGLLEKLQATGRRIGVISHVEELKERIAVKVDISQIGPGTSVVNVFCG